MTACTIAMARRRMAQAFRDNGLDSPDLDARLLTGHALGLDHAALASAAERVLTAREIEAISTLAKRRLAREPVARILGTKEFWGLEFRLSPATLVPRPDTETVVTTALRAIDASGLRERPLRIADLGTGTGALLLALLSELPNATGTGTDISADAIRTARENAVRLGLAARAHFAVCDFSAALGDGFDLVVANPPYVASRDIETLDPEVRAHDPRRALDGGREGLDAYRGIAADARRILAPAGFLVLELGAGQERSVTALLADGGITAVGAERDLSGHFRALLAYPTGSEKASPARKIGLGLLTESD